MTSALRFDLHPTPVGDVLILTDGDALVSVHPIDGPVDAEIERLALRLHDLPLAQSTDASALAAQQLEEYFAGRRRVFDLPLDWRLVRGFTRAALEAVCGIPYGETAGYGEVAVMAGSPGAARAVGTACATTPFSLVVPVHRVVRADGSLGEYGGRPEVKRFLVEFERTQAALEDPAGV